MEAAVLAVRRLEAMEPQIPAVEVEEAQLRREAAGLGSS
jgi:hypothetical protein